MNELDYEKLEVINILKSMSSEEISNIMTVWYFMKEMNIIGLVTDEEMNNPSILSSKKKKAITNYISSRLKEINENGKQES